MKSAGANRQAERVELGSSTVLDLAASPVACNTLLGGQEWDECRRSAAASPSESDLRLRRRGAGRAAESGRLRCENIGTMILNTHTRAQVRAHAHTSRGQISTEIYGGRSWNMLCYALSVAGGGVEVPADAGNGGCCEAAATACCWRC